MALYVPLQKFICTLCRTLKELEEQTHRTMACIVLECGNMLITTKLL